MKRLIVALAILLILPAVVMLTQGYVRGTTEDLSQLVTRAQEAAESGDTQQALSLLDDFDKSLSHNVAVYNLFIRHDELDILLQEGAQLSPLLRGGDDASFSASCAAVQTQLDHIDRMERISWENVL